MGTLTALKAAREEQGMTKASAMRAFVAAAKRRGRGVPEGGTLARMFAYWENQGRKVTEPLYQEILCEIYNRNPVALGFEEVSVPALRIAELEERFDFVSVDAEMVELLEHQTQNYRMLDRKVGAARLLVQTKLHVTQVEELLRDSMPGVHRAGAAAALAEAAALAGWQALDMGDIASAWRLHETAKNGARESGNAAVLAHVTAQQAFALLDSGHNAEAASLIASAHRENSDKLPALLRSWLFAAEAEAWSATGSSQEARNALRQAEKFLPNDPVDEELPFLMLNEGHLARWRGHCLARLGENEAIVELSEALEASSDSVRAQTGLLVDLATALKAQGDVTTAHHNAKRAAELAGHAGSARQRARISKLLAD